MCNKLRQRSHSKMKLISRAQAQELYAPTPEPYATPVEQAPAADLTAQRLQLAQLHDAWFLTDEQFAAGKQKLIAG